MHIEKAGPEHSEELNQFLETHILHGDFDFSFIRKDNYFAKLKLRSEEHETYFIRNKNQKIAACASLVFEESYIAGELQKICWLLDFRIGPDRKCSLLWIDNFFTQLFESAKNQGCKHIFSVIFKDEKHNLASLIRPRTRKRHIPQFLHMKNFKMLSIHGKLPSFQAILSSIRIKKLNENRLEELCLYLNTHSNQRLLGVKFSPDLLQKRLDEWPGFTKENFFVCYDKKKNIVGCYALWDPSPIQEIKIHQHNSYSQNFYYITKFLSLFGLARPPARPGKAFDFYHMTHLYCDNSDIFELMLHHAFFRTKKKALVYPQFEDHLIQLPPKQFLHQSLDFGLYTILPNGENPEQSLKQNPFAPPPDLEIWSI